MNGGKPACVWYKKLPLLKFRVVAFCCAGQTMSDK
jgi:hypothetical protein